jgi:hypothetical protein
MIEAVKGNSHVWPSTGDLDDFIMKTSLSNNGPILIVIEAVDGFLLQRHILRGDPFDYAPVTKTTFSPRSEIFDLHLFFFFL